MKKHIVIATLIAFAGLSSLTAEARNMDAPRVNRSAAVQTPLAAEAAATLLWMREEEKLARDVYQTLYAQWKQPVFQRIARSEQRHFDAIGKRIAQFNLADPALAATGVFSQAELQDLYDQLVFTGTQGYVQALTVGATIEDMDIADLLAAIDETTDPALKRTYGNLLDGSKNHLRAFVTLLRGQGTDYTPVHIDPELFDAIMGD